MAETTETVTAELVHAPAQAAALVPMHFDEEARAIIRTSFLSGASDNEAHVLIKTAERMRLDPFKRQIHFVKRSVYNEDTQSYEKRWAFQTSIDGFRGRAEETGEHEGTDEPVFTFEEVINPITGEPLGRKQLVSRVTVHRKGRRPTVGVARWSEFVQKTRKGEPTHMWLTMPHHMLAKCAEALALRQAYPEQLGGLYTDDEMPSGDEGDGGDGGGDKLAGKRRDLADQAARVKSGGKGATVAPTAGAAVSATTSTATPAAAAPAAFDAATATAPEIVSYLDGEKLGKAFTAAWNIIKARPDYASLDSSVYEAFARNRQRLWPNAAPLPTPAPAAPAAAPAPTSGETTAPQAQAAPAAPVDPKVEKWLGEIARAGGNEGEEIWQALNDAFDADIPGVVLRAFEARWPTEPAKVDGAAGEVTP